MLSLGPLELERRPLVHSSSVVFAASHDSERSRWLEVDGVDGPRLPGDVAVAGAGVGEEDVAELLPALAHHHDPLVVRRPGQVLDRSRDRLELVLQDVLLVHSVPDADFARLVGGGDVESNADINIDRCDGAGDEILEDDGNGNEILEDDCNWTEEIDCMINIRTCWDCTWPH